MQSKINLINSSEATLNPGPGEEAFLRSVPANIRLGEMTPEALRLLVYYVSKQGPFELAVESGYFKGTLAEWLQSLKANFTLKAAVPYYHELGHLTNLSEGDMVYVEETGLVYFYSGEAFPSKESGIKLTGSSAYQLAVMQGFDGTVDDYLASLKGEPFRFNDFTAEQLELIRGPEGKDAYAVAKEDGFQGTRSQWLASLIGPKGDQGDKGNDGVNGKSAYQLAQDAGFQGSMTAWLASLVGEQGDKGLTAFEVALTDGYVGTRTEWLQSLIGDSAYEIAVQQGFQGSVEDWVVSLRGRTAYELAVANGFVGSENQWLESLRGKSAYQLAVQTGYQGTEAQWLTQLRGKNAYSVAVDNGYTGSQEEWLASLHGASAYTLAVANGFNGTLTQWIASLKGDQGEQGISAYQVALNNGFIGSEKEWLDSVKSDSLEGKNLVIKGNVPVTRTPNTYLVGSYNLSEKLEVGKQYTLVAKVHHAPSETAPDTLVKAWISSSQELALAIEAGDSASIVSVTFTRGDFGSGTSINFYYGTESEALLDSEGSVEIQWISLFEGSLEEVPTEHKLNSFENMSRIVLHQLDTTNKQPVTNDDTLLVIIGKLQAQISDLETRLAAVESA